MRRTNEGSGVDVVAISTSGGPTHKKGAEGSVRVKTRLVSILFDILL